MFGADGVQTCADVLDGVEVVHGGLVYAAKVNYWTPSTVLLTDTEDGAVEAASGRFDQVPLKHFVNEVFDDFFAGEWDFVLPCEDGGRRFEVDAVGYGVGPPDVEFGGCEHVGVLADERLVDFGGVGIRGEVNFGDDSLDNIVAMRFGQRIIARGGVQDGDVVGGVEAGGGADEVMFG